MFYDNFHIIRCKDAIMHGNELILELKTISKKYKNLYFLYNHSYDKSVIEFKKLITKFYTILNEKTFSSGNVYYCISNNSNET